VLLLPLALAAEPPDLTGTWRLDLEVQTQATMPVFGGTTVTTHQIMLATVTRGADGRQVQTHDTCDMYATASRAITEPALPRAFVDAIPDKSYPLEFTATADGWRVDMDFKPLHIGYDPGPSAGALPQEIGDPGVIDWDHDGHPGATIRLAVPLFGDVAVYQVQRTHARIRGTILSADRIDGKVRLDEFVQRTIGASNRLFAQNPTLEALAEKSWFRQERVPTGTTCAALGRG
jgi:hypothetical protein